MITTIFTAMKDLACVDTEISMVTIYTLTDPRTSEVRYVGKTEMSLPKRFNGHLGVARNNPKTWVGRWVKELLDEGLQPIMSAVEAVPYEKWEESESYWIRQMRAFGCRLTNTAEAGGKGSSGYRLTEDQRLRQQTALKVALSTPEARERKRQAALACGNKPPVRRGEANNKAKFTEVEVIEIRNLAFQGVTFKEIGDLYGVSTPAIWDIARGTVWAHVGGPLVTTKAKYKLTDEDVERIRDRLRQGVDSQLKIAQDFGIDPSTVSNIKRGKRRSQPRQQANAV